VTAKTLLIAAGGTGGHITPGISIAQAWLAEGGNVVFATLAKNINYPDIVSLAQAKQVAIVAYDAPRLPRLNPFDWVRFFKRFIAAYRLIKSASKSESVDAVVGMGGYSSFPSVLYAILNRKPLYLCEQNAKWGIVTRTAKFFARKIFLSFDSEKELPAKFIVTGNPLRAMFKKKQRGKSRESKQQIFFLGGSQGAQDINSLYSAFARDARAKKYTALVSAGPTEVEAIDKISRKQDTVVAFIETMPEAYMSSDVVVARCGSGTLFEILWSKKRAFLIPYPHAAADHQRANAEMILPYLDAVIFDERPFDVSRALEQFFAFLERPAKPTQSKLVPVAETLIIRYINESLS